MKHPTKLLAALFALFLAAAAPATVRAVDPYFFDTSVSLGNGVLYSQDFGYYNLDYYYGSGGGYVYKYDFGFLYYLGDDGRDGDYFYDFEADDYFYTAGSLYPYIYSYDRGTFLYYFEGSNPREFYDYRIGEYIFY